MIDTAILENGYVELSSSLIILSLSMFISQLTELLNEMKRNVWFECGLRDPQDFEMAAVFAVSSTASKRLLYSEKHKYLKGNSMNKLDGRMITSLS